MIIGQIPKYSFDGLVLHADVIEIKGREFVLRRSLYKNGVWAEIIKAPEPNYEIY